MKRSILLSAILLCFLSVIAQDQLLVHKNDQGFYLSHKVVPKENFYSIGRLYNIPPKDIAGFNQLDMAQGLAVDQVLKIPLSELNFTQSRNNGRPVYYVVGAKEGLYRVSVNNNNVLMANLRKWNKLSTDQISAGQKLVVGYLVSPEAGNIVSENSVPEPRKEVAFETPADQKDAAKKPAVPKKEEPLPADDKKVAPPVQPIQVAVTDGKGGFFKSHYDAQVRAHYAKKDITAATGIFKTASGWQDAKYYALMDGVESGTIIKLVNPDNGKTAYAKVLGEMSGIRQNQGYDVRVSNATAAALGISDTEKFILKVNY